MRLGAISRASPRAPLYRLTQVDVACPAAAVPRCRRISATATRRSDGIARTGSAITVPLTRSQYQQAIRRLGGLPDVPPRAPAWLPAAAVPIRYEGEQLLAPRRRILGPGQPTMMSLSGSGSPTLVAEVDRRMNSRAGGHMATCWSPVALS